MGDHLGLSYISTVEDLAVVKRVIVENVAPDGAAVLNAADPIVARMADACPGAVIFFANDVHHPVMATHRAQGRPVVFVEDDCIVVAEGSDETRIPLREIPLTRNGTIGFQVENAMAATAAASALGLDWDAIRKGLASFVSDAATAPGRFNMFDYRGATLIADYGHNPDAILALVHAIDSIPAKRRLVVISGAGDRRDIDIQRQTEILGDSFDEVILYQDQCQRGRADGEVLALLRQGLAKATRAKAIAEVRGEFLATDTALARLQPGDLCLILVDQVDAALAHIAQRVATA
jgi:cyanophycin synthetase